jgi:hypothetical protein
MRLTLTSMGDGRLRLLRRLRLVLIVALVAWFFSPPELRDEVPLWLPFAIVVALEAQFVISSWRHGAPLVTRDDPRPGLDDRRRYGDGRIPEWAIAEDDEGAPLWVDLSEDEEELVRQAPAPARRRRVARALLEAAAVVAAVGALILFLDRPGWDDLSPQAQRAAQDRMSLEASRVAGKPVRIGCDTSGRYVGAVRHADGVAVPGGTFAYLTPELCYALERLALHGDVGSFTEAARAIAVLAHEAWHLRGVRNEGRTECFALQSGVRVGRRLGLEESTARRMMRSQLVANQLHGAATAEYIVPAGCVNRGPLDLSPAVDEFP